jgi:hypothetical protein
MDLMDKVFVEYMDKFIIVFVDDIWVYSKDEDKHKEHLRLVLQKLQDHMFYAKLNKCEFWLKQVTFLSRVISKEGITMDLT